MAFSRLKVKCFSNVPSIFKLNNPEVYSSDNFYGNILPSSFINLECCTFYPLDNSLYILVWIITTGLLAMSLGLCAKGFSRRKNVVGSLTGAFKEIISNARKETQQKGRRNVQECSQKVADELQDYVELELSFGELFITRKYVSLALNEALKSEWRDIPSKVKKEIEIKGFDSLHFNESCRIHFLCSHKRDSEKKDGELSSILSTPLL